MIDRNVLLWSAKELRKKYRKMVKVNMRLKELFDVYFPFVQPGYSNTWLHYHIKRKQSEMQYL